MERNCLNCQTTFYVKYKYLPNKFCGLKCSAKYNNPKKVCPIKECEKCGKTFEHKRIELSGKFCSRKCSDATNKNQPANIFEKVCSFCNKTFKVQSASNAKLRKTCSRKCSSELKKVYGENNPLFKSVEMNCELCGQTKLVKPCKIHEFRFCSRRCLGTYSTKNQPRISSLELKMKAQFDSINLNYEQQFIIDFYITDFAFPENKLIVECDGVYWHNLPKQIIKDKRKDGYLKHKGWQILRLTEIEIKQNPQDCLEKVLALIN